jgi:exopolyphosphatase/pppGpp-phosphohydrolase
MEEGVQEGLEAIKEFKDIATKDPLASAKVFGTRAFLNEERKR